MAVLNKWGQEVEVVKAKQAGREIFSKHSYNEQML